MFVGKIEPGYVIRHSDPPVEFQKLIALFYSIILLRGLGILLPDDIDVISKLSEQISVISDSDVFPEREDDVIGVIDKVIRQACNM